MEFCMTGLASDNNTYEIFMYAGCNGNLGTAAIPYDEVYVLSLPSFNWFKADYLAANPRHALTCESVGGGQIVTIGGLNTTTNGPDDLYKDVFNTADQFTQGLAIFDLNTMAWKNSYSSKQTSYTPSSAVETYYANNARTPSFSSAGLQQLIAVQNFTTANSGSSGSGSGSGAKPTSKSSSNAGAIAGGVVGGIAVLAIIAGTAMFFVRRRKNKTQQGRNGDGFAQEMPGQAHEKYEMPDSSNPGTHTVDKKLGAGARYEMPSNDMRHELA